MVPCFVIYLESALIQDMAWYRYGARPFLESMLNQRLLGLCFFLGLKNLFCWSFVFLFLLVFVFLFPLILFHLLFILFHLFFQGDQLDSANFLVDQLLYCDFVPKSINCIKKSE